MVTGCTRVTCNDVSMAPENQFHCNRLFTAVLQFGYRLRNEKHTNGLEPIDWGNSHWNVFKKKKKSDTGVGLPD